ncbi:MAG: InlB B-repeat-containing protein [Lachnospiraceae bacterium]|nr:InlB B-repeat-containing protein [Lachnospiraceae bacterium]
MKGLGEQIPEQGVQGIASQEVTEPDPAPQAEGFTFDHWDWLVDGELTPFEFDSDVITQDTTLYANWKRNKYTLEYNIDVYKYNTYSSFGNSHEIVNPIAENDHRFDKTEVFYGSDLFNPNNDSNYDGLSVDFCDFNGWVLQKKVYLVNKPGDQMWTWENMSEIPAKMPAVDLRYRADFTPHTYRIVYDKGTGFDSAVFVNGDGNTLSDNTMEKTYTYFSVVNGKNYIPPLKAAPKDKFLGWYLADGTQITQIERDKLSELPIADDDTLTLYAHWGIESFDLDWDFKGGTASNADYTGKDGEPVEFGTVITPPEITRENYTQLGWSFHYESDEPGSFDVFYYLNELPDPEVTMPADNLTIYAVWEDEEYSVEYITGIGTWRSWDDYPTQADQHDISWMAKQDGTVEAGKDYFRPEVYGIYPNLDTRCKELTGGDSYHFVGWYLKDRTNISSEPLPRDYQNKDDYYEALALYQNKGWDEKTRITKIDADILKTMKELNPGTTTFPVYARFDLNSPELSWDFDGGEPDGEYSPVMPNDGSAIVLNTYDEITLPASVVKAGYVFTNWEFYLEGSTTPMTAAEIEANLGNQVAQGKVFMPNHALLIKAVFAPTDYTVSYENGFAKCAKWKNDLTWSAGTEGKDQFTCESDNFAVRKPADDMVITEGYEFVGWYDGTDPTIKDELLALDPDTTTKEQYDSLNDNYRKIETVEKGTKKNVTLVAVWKRKSYTVTWNLNGATVLTDGSWDSKFAPSVELLDDTYVYQTSAQYKDLIEAPDLSGKRSGYIFKGWYIEEGTSAADGRVKKAPSAAEYNGALVLDVNADENMPADKVTVYAVWEVESYSIEYKYDDTMSGFETQAPDSYTCERSVVFPDLAPTSMKYEFMGWYTEPPTPNQPLSPNAVWNDDAKLDCTTIGMTGNLILYPRWKIRMESFSLDFDGGIPVGEEPYTTNNMYEYGKALKFPTLSKNGYSFEGWTITATVGDVELTPVTVKPEDLPINYSTLTKSLKCKAVFKPITYTITYNKGLDTAGLPIGDFKTGERVLYTYTIEDIGEGYTIPLHVASDRPDMTFLGWYQADSRPDDPDPANSENWVATITNDKLGNKNLWAVWIGNKEYEELVKKELGIIDTLIKAVEAQLIDGKVVLTPAFEQKLDSAWTYYGGSIIAAKEGTSVESVAKLISYHDDFNYLAQQKASRTVESIKAIGEVTYDDLSEARINKARQAYDEASPVKATAKLMKTMMPNAVETLVAAEQKYASLGAKDKTDKAASTAALKKMQDIPDPVSLTSADKAAIDDAVAAYEALSADQKKLLPSSAVNRMYAAAETYDSLAKTNAQNRKQANEAIAKLKLVPKDISLTDSDKKTMEEARKTYDALTGEQKNLVPKDLVANLEKAEKDYVAKTEAEAKKKYKAAYKKWAKKNTSEAKITKKIRKTKTDTKNVKGAKYINLKLVASSQKEGIRLKWKRVKKAKGYLIYGAPYGSKMRLLDTVAGRNKTSWSQEELSPNSYYKYIVVAYTNVKKFHVKKVLTVSETVYASPKSDTLSNPKSVDNGYLTSSVVASPGEKLCVEAQMIMDNKIDKQLVGVRYESSNRNVATVDSKGNVVCKKPGKAVIYAIAQNGLAKGLSIMVNKEQE